MGNKIPNLDTMSESELWAFWKTYHRPTRKEASELIGDTRPDYTIIASTLANYACNKAVAMKCRIKGDITAASVYEHGAQLCYQRLPADLRW